MSLGLPDDDVRAALCRSRCSRAVAHSTRCGGDGLPGGRGSAWGRQTRLGHEHRQHTRVEFGMPCEARYVGDGDEELQIVDDLGEVLAMQDAAPPGTATGACAGSDSQRCGADPRLPARDSAGDHHEGLPENRQDQVGGPLRHVLVGCALALHALFAASHSLRISGPSRASCTYQLFERPRFVAKSRARTSSSTRTCRRRRRRRTAAAD